MDRAASRLAWQADLCSEAPPSEGSTHSHALLRQRAPHGNMAAPPATPHPPCQCLERAPVSDDQRAAAELGAALGGLSQLTRLVGNGLSLGGCWAAAADF